VKFEGKQEKGRKSFCQTHPEAIHIFMVVKFENDILFMLLVVLCVFFFIPPHHTNLPGIIIMPFSALSVCRVMNIKQLF
jgi:hypothetical protein